MNEELEEIIKIAWRAAPANTEYYLARYIADLMTEKSKTLDSMINADLQTLDVEDQDFYRGLVQKEKALARKIEKLNRLISSMRGA